MYGLSAGTKKVVDVVWWPIEEVRLYTQYALHEMMNAELLMKDTTYEDGSNWIQDVSSQILMY